MDDAERQRKIDDAHRAVGRYLVEFSSLIARMRWTMEQRLRRPEDPRILAYLVFADSSAATIASAFFAMCKALGEFDEAEAEICKKLQDKILFDLIPKRNDIAHGDWWVEVPWREHRQDGSSTPSTYYVRTKVKSGKGPAATAAEPADIDVLSDDLRVLRMTIEEFGLICFGLHPCQENGQRPDLRVSDVYDLRGSKGRRAVVREGPVAQTLRFADPIWWNVA